VAVFFDDYFASTAMVFEKREWLHGEEVRAKTAVLKQAILHTFKSSETFKRIKNFSVKIKAQF
jgi:hypothetical protein